MFIVNLEMLLMKHHFLCIMRNIKLVLIFFVLLQIGWKVVLNNLNGHAETPKTEEDFLSFVMFSCMVLDAVKHVLKQLDIEKIDKIDYFQNICLSKPLNIEKHKCPTDDKFFEYLRSIMFAHPFETNRPKFFMKHEIQYSPWVIANNPATKFRGIKDGVGVRIYSNKL